MMVEAGKVEGATRSLDGMMGMGAEGKDVKLRWGGGKGFA